MTRVYATPSSFTLNNLGGALTQAVTFSVPQYGAQSAAWGAQGAWVVGNKGSSCFNWATAGGGVDWCGLAGSGAYTSTGVATAAQITDINLAVGGTLSASVTLDHTSDGSVAGANVSDAVSSVWLDYVPCTFSITPVTATFGPEGGTGSEALVTQSPCPWTPTSDAAWLTVTSPVGRQLGNGTVSYSVAANATTSQRTGHIMCGSAVFTVTQNGCDYILSPTGASYPVVGGTGTFNVLTESVCPWAAVSNNPSWLVITGGLGGPNGQGSINYSVAAQAACGVPRVGTITAGGQTFTVNQAGQGTAVVTLQTQKWSPENADATEIYLLTYPCGYYRADLNALFGTPYASFDTAAYAGAGSASVVSGVVVVYDSTGVELSAGAACSSVNVWRYIYA